MEGKKADDPILLEPDSEDTGQTESSTVANIQIKEEPRSPSPSNAYSHNTGNDGSSADNSSTSQSATGNYTSSTSNSSTSFTTKKGIRPFIFHRVSNEIEIVYEKYTITYGVYAEEFHDIHCSDEKSEARNRKIKITKDSEKDIYNPAIKIKEEPIDDESAQSHRSRSPQTTCKNINTSTAVSVSSGADMSISSSESITEEQNSAANHVLPALLAVQEVINCQTVSTSAGVDNVPISSDQNVYFTSPSPYSSLVKSSSGRKDCMSIAVAETHGEEVRLDNLPFMENQMDVFNTQQTSSVFSTQVNSAIVSPFAREDFLSIPLNENHGEEIQLDNPSCMEDQTNDVNSQYDDFLILNQFCDVEEATVEISACPELSLSSNPEVDGSDNEISVSDECNPDAISVIKFIASQNATNASSFNTNGINSKNIDDEGNPSIPAFPEVTVHSGIESTIPKISIGALISKKNQSTENNFSKEITGFPSDSSIRDQMSEGINHANGKKTFSIRPTTKKRKTVKSGETLERKVNALREELKSREKVSSEHIKSTPLLPTVDYNSPSQVSNNEEALANMCFSTDVSAADANDCTTNVCSNNDLSDKASKALRINRPKKTWLAQYCTSSGNESDMESATNAAVDNIPNSRSSIKRKSPTYKDMIREVFLRSDEKKLLAREVVSCVGAHFPECTTRVSWKKSVAGALSANICFKRIPPSTRQTRAGHWTYVPELDVSRTLMKAKGKKVFRREYVTVRIYDNDQREQPEGTKNITCTRKLRSETFACRNNEDAGVNTLSYNVQTGEDCMSVPLNYSTNLNDVSVPETQNLRKDFHSEAESLNSSTEGLGPDAPLIETSNNLRSNEEVFFPPQQSITEHELSASSSNLNSVSSSLPTSTCLNDIPLNMLQEFLETVPTFSHDSNPQGIARNIEREMNSNHFTKNMSSNRNTSPDNRNSLVTDNINETLMHAGNVCINIPGQIPNPVMGTYVPDETLRHAGNVCINIPGQIPNSVRTTYVPDSTLPSFNSSFKTKSYFNSVPGNNLIYHNHLLNPHNHNSHNSLQSFYSPYNINMPGVPAIYSSGFPYDSNQTSDALLMRNQEHYNYYASASPYTYGNLTSAGSRYHPYNVRLPMLTQSSDRNFELSAEGSHCHSYNVRLPMLTQSSDINFELSAEGSHCHPHNVRLPMLTQSSDRNFELSAEGSHCHPHNVRLPMLTQSSDRNFEMLRHSPPSFNHRAPYFGVPRPYGKVSGLWYDMPNARKSHRQPFP